MVESRLENVQLSFRKEKVKIRKAFSAVTCQPLIIYCLEKIIFAAKNHWVETAAGQPLIQGILRIISFEERYVTSSPSTSGKP